MSIQSLYVESLTPNMMESGDGGLWEIIKVRYSQGDGTCMMDQCQCKEEEEIPEFPFSAHVKKSREHTARWWPSASQAESVSSVAQSCPTLCDPMDCSTPGFPIHHQLPELTQTHVHRVSDAIQPFHPLLSPLHPDFNLSQHQVLFK